MFERRLVEMLRMAEESGLRREILEVCGRGRCVHIGRKTLLNFSSNDYLGLATDRRVVEALRKAALEEGVSSTASRLICGDSPQLRILEERLSRLKNRPTTLALPSGYHANIAAICSIARKGDFILSDQNNHASIIDACRLSRAETLVFNHNDAEHLDYLLARTPSDSLRLVVTEGVFSTDGDICALDEIVPVVRRHGAVLMVDEAHSTGTLPPKGRGIEDYFALVGSCDIVMGTLGKAIGAHGGFLCGSPAFVSLLVTYARTGLYSTALPPPIAAAAAEAVNILLLEGERLLSQLHRNIDLLGRLLLEQELIKQKPKTPIISVTVGDERSVVSVRQRMIENGFLVGALRYPTVPKSKASIRISVSRIHTEEDIVRLVSALLKVLFKEMKHDRST